MDIEEALLKIQELNNENIELKESLSLKDTQIENHKTDTENWNVERTGLQEKAQRYFSMVEEQIIGQLSQTPQIQTEQKIVEEATPSLDDIVNSFL